MNPNATAQAQARRDEFIRVLAESGSAVQARRVVGITSRTVRKWMEDEEFLDRYNDAVETAQDAIRAKVREMALAGSEPMLALSMKVIEPSLRPRGVQVGVQVNGAAGEPDRSPEALEELAAKLRKIFAEAEMRGEDPVAFLLGPDADVVNVEALPAPSPASASQRLGEGVGASDDAERAVEATVKPPSIEDLL